MTHDTEEHIDPFKINISLEDDEDGKCKEYFEKGLNALIADKHFLLLYVPENGCKMQVIRPAIDSYHRQRIIKRINEAKRIPSFYYALSHLWGVTKENRYHWNDISEHAIDEEGQPVKPVSMRPEKRDALLALLKDHPDSYWWIDVLCARVDTPLDIMGDIYGCCLECIAMIDCEVDLISALHTKKYVIPEHTTDFPTREQLLNGKKIYRENPDLIDILYTFMQSKWWQRVWTWQEMALPFGDIRFMSETDTQRLPCNTITMDNLSNSCNNGSEIIDYIHHRMMNTLSETEEMLLWMCEIQQARAFNKKRMQKMEAIDFYKLVKSLGYSRRQCMDPADFVYGVLGMLQIKIPRLNNPDDVWACFLHELENYMKTNSLFKHGTKTIYINDWVYNRNISKAEYMCEIYGKLLELDV